MSPNFFLVVCLRASERKHVSGFIKTRRCVGGSSVFLAFAKLHLCTSFLKVHLAQFTSPQATGEEDSVGHIMELDSPPEAPDALRHAFTGGARAEYHDSSQTSQFCNRSSRQCGESV